MQTEAGKEKFAVGMAVTFTVWLVTGDVQPPAEVVRVIVFEPAVDQLTVCGPAIVAVAGLAPAPKFQA
jgi:hypothetical protein